MERDELLAVKNKFKQNSHGIRKRKSMTLIALHCTTVRSFIRLEPAVLIQVSTPDAISCHGHAMMHYNTHATVAVLS